MEFRSVGIVGGGFVGKSLAETVASKGIHVTVLERTEAGAAALPAGAFGAAAQLVPASSSATAAPRPRTGTGQRIQRTRKGRELSRAPFV